jgi:hypothetical protein
MTWGKRPQDKVLHDYDFLAFNAWSMCGMAVWPVQDVQRKRKGRRCKVCERTSSSPRRNSTR